MCVQIPGEKIPGRKKQSRGKVLIFSRVSRVVGETTCLKGHLGERACCLEVEDVVETTWQAGTWSFDWQGALCPRQSPELAFHFKSIRLEVQQCHENVHIACFYH